MDYIKKEGNKEELEEEYKDDDEKKFKDSEKRKKIITKPSKSSRMTRRKVEDSEYLYYDTPLN
jgi:hypothetical protein